MQKLGLGSFTQIVLALALAACSARGQIGNTPSGNEFSLDENFRPGFREFSLGVGPMFSPVGSDFSRPVINWVEGYAQLGYMLTEIHGDGLLRGNVELLGEAFGAGIYEETGHYIAGGTIWGRYNFIPAGMRFSPYVQAGLGAESMDINHKYDGHNFNFNVDASGGVRYFITDKVSINAEFRFQHLSNADTGSRNIGVNAVGPMLGMSWFF